jgi:outer membrane protein, heavy metal efflux system
MSSFFRFSHPVPLLGLTFLLASGVAAQEAAPPTLSLDEALRRTTERNPGLAAQGYAERAAEALIEQAGLRPNPTLDVSLENFAGTGGVQGVRGLESTVQASQTIERGGKRAKRVALAGREREAAANEFAVRRTEVLSAAATAYIGVLAAQQRLALAAEPLKLARETVSAVDQRVKAAIASPAEAARARVALAAAQADYARAEAGLATARAALAALWGGRPADVPRVAGLLQIPAELPAADPYLVKLAEHPRLVLQQSVIAGRRASLELEQAQAVQDVTVGGGLRFLREGTDAAFVAGVTVPLPVHNRNQGNIRAAREYLTGAELAVRAVEVELRAAFTAAWQDLTAAHTAAQNLRREALPATEEAYATVRHAYDQGQLPLIDVLDAQRALVGLRRELLDAEAAYATALARVEALTDASFATLTTLINRS